MYIYIYLLCINIYIYITQWYSISPSFRQPKWPHVLSHDLGELVEGQVVRLILEGALAGHGRSFHASIGGISLRWELI